MSQTKNIRVIFSLCIYLCYCSDNFRQVWIPTLGKIILEVSYQIFFVKLSIFFWWFADVYEVYATNFLIYLWFHEKSWSEFIESFLQSAHWAKISLQIPIRFFREITRNCKTLLVSWNILMKQIISMKNPDWNFQNHFSQCWGWGRKGSR